MQSSVEQIISILPILYLNSDSEVCNLSEEYPDVSNLELSLMYFKSYASHSSIQVFPYVKCDGERYYVELFFVGRIAGNNQIDYERFILAPGNRLPDDRETMFIHLLREEKLSVEHGDFLSFMDAVKKRFPDEMNVSRYDVGMTKCMKLLLENMYFSFSHAGILEKLYKAGGLHNVAYNLFDIDGANLAASRLNYLLGISIRQLRALSKASMIKFLVGEGRMETAVKTVKAFPDLVSSDKGISSAQFLYLMCIADGDSCHFKKRIYDELTYGREEEVHGIIAFNNARKELMKKGIVISELESIWDTNPTRDKLEEYFDMEEELEEINLDIKANSMDVKIDFEQYIGWDCKSAEEILSESINQSNCLFPDYLSKARTGEVTIVILRKKKNSQKSYISIAINHDGNMVEAYGTYNRVLEDDERELLRKIADQFGLTYEPMKTEFMAIQICEDEDELPFN